MLPLFDTFKKELLEKEVDALDIASMQTSVITKYFPQLGTTKTWDVAIQSAVPINKNDPSDGFIILDRTFQDLVFHPDAYDFDYIKTDKEGVEFYTPTKDEEDKLGDNSSYLSKFNYWLVVQCMTVREWFSNNSEELQDFLCWEYKEHIYQQEIYFKHKLIHTDVWTRPTLPGETQTVTTGGTVSSPGVTTTTCDIGAGASNPTYDNEGNKISTGNSPTFENDLGCKKWESLEVPFTRTVNAKSALGAVIKLNDSSLSTKVYLKDPDKADGSPGDKVEIQGLGSFEDPIQLVKQYIEIVVENPGKSDLKSITIDFYGEEWYRIQLPFKYDEETDYIMHDKESLSNTDKLHPPRKINNSVWSTPLFKTDFRLNKEFTPISSFGSRMGEKF